MAKNNKRIPIPQEIQDAVIFEADITCCMCRKPGLAFHIHHIDGDPANNLPINLVALCLEDHARVSSKSPIGKGITPGVVAKYKSDWCATVRARKEAALVRPVPVEGSIDAYMEALACHEIRKLVLHIDMKDWGVVEKCLDEIAPYSASWAYGDSVRYEVLDFLYSLSCATRHDMPISVATRVEHMAITALPISSLVAPAQKPPSDSQTPLFRTGLTIGFSMAHDGVKYLKSFDVTLTGLQVLRQVLRYAHLNRLKDIKKECLGYFEHFLEVAGYAKDEKAVKWAIFERDDALALDGDPLPQMPK